MVAEPSKMEADLQKTSFVYIKRGSPPSGLSPLYQGPYKVLSREVKVFQVDVGGRQEVISADRLKQHMGTSPVQPAEPPRRGLPPASGVGDRGWPPEKLRAEPPARGGSVEARTRQEIRESYSS
jgi:hypothetical protein